MRVNEHLLRIIVRDAIAKLPRQERELYEWIDKLETSLISKSDSPGAYLNLLQKHSPYHEAGAFFHMNPSKVRKIMQRVEVYLSDQVEEKIITKKWLEAPSYHSNRKKFTLYI